LTDTRVLLGIIAAAHGIRGEVKVKTFTESPGGLSAYGPVTTKDGRELQITSLRVPNPGEAVVRLRGIDDRNAAESLKGQALYVPRDALPKPDEDEYYLTDLIGLRAEDAAGNALGLVRGVQNFGAGDMIEIEFADGASEFVPFTREAVPAVDIAGGRVIIEFDREP
jgi:16S rRNA processing protein RimM